MFLYRKVSLLFVLLFLSPAILANPPTPSTSASINTYQGMSGNPAAVNLVTGSAAVQKYFENKWSIQNNHGLRIGGLWLGDVNDLFSGGIPDADRVTTNSSLILDLSVDMEKLAQVNGGLFDIQFLQFNGQATNQQAGSAQGYNSLPGHPPLNRTELYQLWYRQALLEDKLILRAGKTAPSVEFGNVSKPVPLEKSNLNIPAVSSLIYTPLFVNPTMYGVIPGYYNSTYGITANIAPIKQWYVSLGIYQGALAQGVQTGLKGPVFNGTYFYIGETGFAWMLGNRKPGYIGLGAWRQSGKIETSPTLFETNASGTYIYGTQRLWYQNPNINNVGISSFYQLGHNNSHSLPMHGYVGGGLTGFGLIPSRIEDSVGIGLAFSWLNQNIFNQRTELMYQAYYQSKIIKDVYLEPALTYIPTPAAGTKLSAAWAGTLRAIVLF